MPTRRPLVPCLLLALALVPGVSSAQAKTPAPPRRVLFIGNSYTFFNNLPALVAGLAEAAGLAPLEVRMVAAGGWRLIDHWEKGEARQVLRSGKWDFVILQEQSQLGDGTVVNGRPRITSDRVFAPAAAQWAKAIVSAGARPVFYLTWAKEAVPEDQAVLNDAYRRAAQAGGARVAPVGIAWSRVRESAPGLRLFDADGSHPSPAGSYLAACTILATLFGANPQGLPGRVVGTPVDRATERAIAGTRSVLVDVTPDQARVLQAAAWKAVQEAGRGGK